MLGLVVVGSPGLAVDELAIVLEVVEGAPLVDGRRVVFLGPGLGLSVNGL